MKNEKLNWFFFAKFKDKLKFSKVNLISSIITALQQLVMVAKDIFPLATVTDGCKEADFMDFSNKIYISCETFK